MGEIKSYIDEEWKFIITKAPTLRCHYYISNYGRVKSVAKSSGSENLRKPSMTGGKYPALGLKLKGNVNQGIAIRKLVAQYFLNDGRESKLKIVNIDSDLTNNHVSNLKYLTQEEHTKWHIDRGWMEASRKSRQKYYKMNEAKVKLLLRRIKEGKTKKKIIAKQFNITPMQLNRIERGENWGHVKLDDDDEE